MPKGDRRAVGSRSVEGADLEERVGQCAAVVSFADLVGVAAQGEAGRAGIFRNSLSDGGHRRGNDGYGQEPYD